MTGSRPFLIEKNFAFFERSFKKLAKSYKSKSQQQEFVKIISSFLEELILDPYPSQSRNEPLPSKVNIPENWTFHKLNITVCKGGSGQIRLMYLVNEKEGIIRPLWLYSHEQFEKRPIDADIRSVLEESFDEADVIAEEDDSQ